MSRRLFTLLPFTRWRSALIRYPFLSSPLWRVSAQAMKRKFMGSLETRLENSAAAAAATTTATAFDVLLFVTAFPSYDFLSTRKYSSATSWN